MSNFVLIDARRPLPQFGTDPDISMDSEGLDISFQTALPNIVEVFLSFLIRVERCRYYFQRFMVDCCRYNSIN